jgi:hypothetical protein
MNRKMATYLRFGPVVALLAIVLAVALALPVERASAVVTIPALGVTISPTTPGAAAQYSITFTTDRDLPANTGQIIITLDSDVGIPTSISKSNVFISATVVGVGGTLGVPSQTVNPAIDPVIQVDDLLPVGPSSTANSDPKRRAIVITVGDMDPGTVSPSTGVQNIGNGAGASVTVTFSQAANLTNPLAAQNPEVLVRTVVAGVADPVGAVGIRNTGAIIPRVLSLSAIDGSRGTIIGVVGSGFKKNLTAVVFIDINGNGVQNLPGDATLAEALVGADGKFTTTITMGGSFAVGSNTINATEGITTPAPQGVAVVPTLRLRGKVTPTPTTVGRSDTVNLKLEDFAATGVVTELSIGGVSVLGVGPVPGAPVILGDGTQTFNNVPIPAAVGIGVKEIRASVGAVGAVIADSGRTATLTVKAATIRVAPATAVPNQSITFSGSGFTTGGLATIGASNITIGGAPTVHPAIGVDNGGTWVVTLIMPINATTLTPGAYDVRATDTGVITGDGKLTIPARTLSLSPASSALRSVVTVKGSGYPANNTAVGADNRQVTVAYLGTAPSVTSDSSGSFELTLTVPSAAVIPSDNTVIATIQGTTSTASAIHSVPAAVITVSPTSGSPGTPVTVTGTGFLNFATMTALTIGGRPVLPLPAPDTNREGRFTATVTAPDLDPGTVSVVVVLGGITASSSFIVTAAPVAPPPPPPAVTLAPATALAPLGDNLERVFNFNNQTKGWTFYDPRPAFAAASDIREVVTERIYWFLVKKDTTVTLGGKERKLFAGWNLVTW